MHQLSSSPLAPLFPTGLPAWLRDIPGMQFRMHNEPFERGMEIFTTLIVNKLKEANMFAGQGGPIILSQIENEYGNIMTNLKDAQSASQYIHWCADMANKQDVGVPWIMCQQDADVPSNVELASTIAKLEESNHKLAALKAQRDNTQGTPILFPTLRNKNASEDKVRDKQRELQDLEVTRKELTELTSKRLVEIKRLHEERIELLNKLTIFQDTLTDFKNIRSSKAFQPVNDQLQKSHAELDHYQTLLEKLQVDKDNFVWQERKFNLKVDLAEIPQRVSAYWDSRIADLDFFLRHE